MEFMHTLKYFGILALIFLAMGKISEINNRDKTTLEIHNPTVDTLTVYLTLDMNGENWVQDVNGIFGIKSDKLSQGAFLLLPNEVVSYQSDKPFSGNISFNAPPLNCPFPAPTLFEFCLNNKNTVVDAQETVDISCVYGVTTIGSFTLEEGGIWNSGQNDTVTYIKNDVLYKNTGRKGVFPYGCTTCIGRQGMVNCSNKKKYEKVNKKNICNVQRDSKNSGGIVRITYICDKSSISQ